MQQDIASAALRDQGHVERSRTVNAEARRWLTDALRAAGVDVDESFGNFVLARFDSPETADAVDTALQAGGILVRKMDGYGLPQALRITVGTMPDCHRLACIIVRTLGSGQ